MPEIQDNFAAALSKTLVDATQDQEQVFNQIAPALLNIINQHKARPHV